MVHRSLFGLTLLLGVTFPGYAMQVYKWTDSNGVVHYDQAPHGNGETLDIPSQASPGPTPSVSNLKNRFEAQRDLSESIRKERVRRQEARDQTKREKAEAMENCDKAKSQLNTYKLAGRIVRYDERGERQFLSDEERNRGIHDANERIAKWCK